jgi:hypothetical protein
VSRYGVVGKIGLHMEFSCSTLAIKMPIAFPSLLCGIIVSQRPDVLVKEDMAFSAHNLDVGSNVGTSVAGAMSRKDMIGHLQGLRREETKVGGCHSRFRT